MYPRLFELGPITVYTYGVLLAAAYLLGLKFAMVRAKAIGLDAVRVLDLGIYIIISALVGAKLLLLITDFGSFRADPRGTAHAGAVRRRVLRRPDSRGDRRALVHPPRRPAVVDDVRRIRAGHCPGPRRRTIRLFLRRLLFWKADDAALGDHLHGSVCRRQCRHAARRAPAPHAAVRGGCRGVDSAGSAADGKEGQTVSRAGRSGCTSCSTPCRGSSSNTSAATSAGRSASSRPRSSSRSSWRRWRLACWSTSRARRRRRQRPRASGRPRRLSRPESRRARSPDEPGSCRP